MYIAGPYSGKSPEEIALNIEFARAVGRYLARLGHFPVIPHANSAEFDRKAPDIGYEFWLNKGLGLLKRCDAICLIPGWENSKGSMLELKTALEHNLQVFELKMVHHNSSELRNKLTK
jgi:hypothetical protein